MARFDWSALDPAQFEELCKELMRRKGFLNVTRTSGPGPGDMGRDLHAEEILISQTGRPIHSKILVQCKNYWRSRKTVGPAQVERAANRARTLHYNRVLIITSYDLSSQAKQIALNTTKNLEFGVRVEWWNESDLNTLLFKYPDVKRQFSLDPVAPPVINLGILNGYGSEPSQEKACDPVYSRVSPDYWNRILHGENTSISLIPAAEIDTRFDAILNPFGEVYPEEDPISRKTYRRILDYIADGGSFVNTAGFPFFYYWDPIKGKRHTATEPAKLIIDRQTHQAIQFFSWADTSFYRDFKVTVDSGDSRKIRVFQKAEDKQFVGDLMALGINEVKQFRGLTSLGTAIPLLRAEEEKLYPLAAIPYGHGYLLAVGMDLYEREAPIVALALKNWLLTAGGQIPLRQ